MLEHYIDISVLAYQNFGGYWEFMTSHTQFKYKLCPGPAPKHPRTISMSMQNNATEFEYSQTREDPEAAYLMIS